MNETKTLLEITTTNIYKKSLQRFNMTKYQTGQKTSMKLIDFLLDYFHDNQLKK
jgi:hypothetical protein